MKKFEFRIRCRDIESLRTGLAITISLLIVFTIILVISKAPGAALYSFTLGPLKSVRRIGSVIEEAVPLIFTGLSVILLQRSGLFNLAMEGAFFIAAATAAAIILAFHVPLPVAMLTGTLTGGIVCAIPTVLKVKCNSNVLVTSLMLNYICFYVGLYIIVGHFLDPKINTAFSYKFPEGSLLPRLFPVTRINTGLLIALACVVIVWFINNRTSFGFKVTMIGKNPVMARYAGMKIDKLIVAASFIGGMLAGLGGTVDMFGMYTRFQYTALTNYGWDGILVAILAKQKAQYVPLAALFLGYMRVGANVMSMQSDIPSEMISIIQAVIIILVSAQALLKNYRKKLIIKETQESEAGAC
jgi:general nucleoside transport system permease protein